MLFNVFFLKCASRAVIGPSHPNNGAEGALSWNSQVRNTPCLVRDSPLLVTPGSESWTSCHDMPWQQPASLNWCLMPSKLETSRSFQEPSKTKQTEPMKQHRFFVSDNIWHDGADQAVQTVLPESMHTTPYNCVCLAFFFNLWVLYVPPAGVGFLQVYLILFPPAASQNQENVKNYDIPPNKRKKRKTSGHRRIEKST